MTGSYTSLFLENISDYSGQDLRRDYKADKASTFLLWVLWDRTTGWWLISTTSVTFEFLSGQFTSSQLQVADVAMTSVAHPKKTWSRCESSVVKINLLKKKHLYESYLNNNSKNNNIKKKKASVPFRGERQDILTLNIISFVKNYKWILW